MPTPEDADDAVAELKAITERYVRLIDSEHPEGLVLLRQLRSTLADLYAFIAKIRGHGVFASRTSSEAKPPSEGEAPLIRDQLIRRLPSDLYWSALLPLTWETVGSKGVQLLADALIDVRRAPVENTTIFLLQLELPSIGRQVLDILVILHEIVGDLEAYESAWIDG